MKSKIAIVSLRFNPAFIQFLIAYARAVRELGFEPEFVLVPSYLSFPELRATARIRSVNEAVLAADCSHAFFLNPSVMNRDLAIALKQAGTKILYLLHEPWQMSFGFVWGEGLIPALKGAMAHHVTVPTLKLADLIILPSRCALREYRKRDVRYNGNCVYMPLLFDDEATTDISEILKEKRYFGYIGSLGRSHGFDQYLKFMRHALRRNLDIPFLIASRNKFPDRLMKDPLFAQNTDRIDIRCGRPLSNEEMNRCYAESICVWNLYRRSTQSGVLPKAFMFGTPAIAGPIGSFPEFIQEGVNGRFVDARDHEGIWAALEDMRSNIAKYALNCRHTFLEMFYYRAHLLEIAKMLQ